MEDQAERLRQVVKDKSKYDLQTMSSNSSADKDNRQNDLQTADSVTHIEEDKGRDDLHSMGSASANKDKNKDDLETIIGRGTEDKGDSRDKQNADRGSSSMEIVTITSGKGGVGKTSFAVNFSIALAKRGKRVIIMDADFGLSNVDLVSGISSKYDITDLLNGRKTLNEIMVEGHEGVRFISGGSGLTQLININSEQVAHIMKNLEQMEKEADILVIDTGAGVSDLIMQMVNASDETLLVLTPEPTSIMDAFAMMKRIFKTNSAHKIRIVVNRAETEGEAKAIAENFMDVVEKFLGVRVTCLGSITTDKGVVKAIKSQVPFIVGNPSGSAAVQVGNIADDYLNIPRSEKKAGGGFGEFVKKLMRKK